MTSWDMWEGAQAAFPIESGFTLRDDETGREWRSSDLAPSARPNERTHMEKAALAGKELDGD